jgi:hypothetical protein
MEAKHEFTISNVRLTIDLCLSLVAVLGFGGLSLYLLFGVAKTVFAAFNSGIWLEAAALIGIAVVGIIHILLFVFMIVTFVKIIRVHYHLFSLVVAVLEDGIEIVSRSDKCFIPQSDIMHIFQYRTGITLVWKYDDSPITFYVRNNLFGGKTVKEMAGLLSRFEGYTDDENEIKHVRKSLKLNHIFRKNRYEYQLCRKSCGLKSPIVD